MKKGTIAAILFSGLILMAFVDPPKNIQGRWLETRIIGADTFRLLYIFRADSSVDLLVNGKAFGTGKYRVKEDTMSIADPICNAAYFGKYYLEFSGEDSVTFKVISDTCQGRNVGMSGASLVKVKRP